MFDLEDGLEQTFRRLEAREQSHELDEHRARQARAVENNAGVANASGGDDDEDEWSDVEVQEAEEHVGLEGIEPVMHDGNLLKRKAAVPEGEDGDRDDAPPAKQPKRTKNQKKHAGRKYRRQHVDALDYKPQEHVSKNHPIPKIVQIDDTVEDFARANGDWTGLPDRRPAHIPPDAPLERYLQAGFRLLPWEGEKAELVASRENRIVIAMAGRPVGDPTWLTEVAPGCKAVMDKEYHNLQFGSNGSIPAPPGNAKNKKKNRRAGKNKMKTATQGISYGGGQQVSVLCWTEQRSADRQQLPGVLKQNPNNLPALDRLFTDDNMKRALGFAALAEYFPLQYGYCTKSLRNLLGKYRLKRNTTKSLFPVTSFNFGPQAVTVKHRDNSNMADGLCWIMALGNFDPKVGGHLVLWELKLVIEFPPGSCILIPSAVISHSNVPIQKHEERASITSYCPGGLLRFEAAGCRSLKRMRKEDPEAAAMWDLQQPTLYQDGMKRFSKFDELVGDRGRVFGFSV